jgi:hypothetical protein
VRAKLFRRIMRRLRVGQEKKAKEREENAHAPHKHATAGTCKCMQVGRLHYGNLLRGIGGTALRAERSKMNKIDA